MSERDRRLLLEDMLEAALKIKRYTDGYELNAFLSDDKTLDAVIRNFEIIGEAAGRIDEEFKSENTELSWTHLRGFRNRIVHEYFGIDYEIVWAIIESDLETYIEWLEVYLAK